MAKTVQKDIAIALANKKSMDVAEAEKYVDTFFSLIEEALVSDKVVKVKGFGTFKLVDVRDRESVDVNTGDRVVIDGHSKVSFQPDSTLKELVNKPFSQFETVILNDGVDFEAEMGSPDTAADVLADNDMQTVDETANMEDAEKAEDTDAGNGQRADADTSRIGSVLSDASLNVKSVASVGNDCLAESENGINVSGTGAVQQGARDRKLQGAQTGIQRVDNEEIPDNVVFSTSIDSDNPYQYGASQSYRINETESEAKAACVNNSSVAEPINLTVDKGSALPNRKAEDPTAEFTGRTAAEAERLLVAGPEKKSDEHPEEKSADRDMNNIPKAEQSQHTGIGVITLWVITAILVLGAIFYIGYSMGESSKEDEYEQLKADGQAETKKAKTAVRVRKPLKTAAHKEPNAEEGVFASNINADENDDSAHAGKASQDANGAIAASECANAKSGAAANTPGGSAGETVDNALQNARQTVKTGAYAIEGTDKTVKLKPGQTVERLARFYLGEGMECYIIVHNGKSSFYTGESINIPKLRLKKKASNKKVS